MGIFDKRLNYKPFEYPEVMQFVDAINKSYWVHNEIDFTADIQDFHTNLTDIEKEVIKRSLLSIAQIEVAVKSFWGDLFHHIPKPEFNGLGATLAENEFRHSEAYSRLLEVLGYNKEFEEALKHPIFLKRVELVNDNLKGNQTNFYQRMLFFTIVIENTSLFSQFANILSFTRFKGYMKNVSNIIAWTSVDEQIHANAGTFILNIIKKESTQIIPSFHAMMLSVIEFESELLDWIYEKGELDFFSKEDMLNFMKFRMDESAEKLGFPKTFNITSEQYKPMKWFEEEVSANALDDFFAKRPVDYTKHDKPSSGKDLF